ncbi:hypothetical protein I6M39_03715 [Shewanella algae]|uniref:hypothetical protein n=1 Tax=Shewanella algae TaxID=38313 RepID=UPI001AAD40D2|nr:hypothetical protein [Shewanella algae]MBO2568109.1 hypothetical protein [Shewanella algae]
MRNIKKIWLSYLFLSFSYLFLSFSYLFLLLSFVDKALSRLIDLPNHLGKLSIEDGYQNIQLEFNNLLPDSNQRYDFKDALHSVSFVYEKGAWRLDSVSQLPIRHYDKG